MLNRQLLRLSTSPSCAGEYLSESFGRSSSCTSRYASSQILTSRCKPSLICIYSRTRYVLDNFATVAEAIEGLKKVNAIRDAVVRMSLLRMDKAMSSVHIL